MNQTGENIIFSFIIITTMIAGIMGTIILYNNMKDPGLPPDYKLMRSARGDRYTIVFPGEELSHDVWRDLIKAKEDAWEIYYWRRAPNGYPSDRYEWEEYE